MLRRFFLAALLAFSVSPAFAQPAPQPANLAVVRVSLETSAGTILLELDAAHAPVTTANFLRYVDQKKYDGAVFYRSMKLADTGLIQGGIRDPRKLLPPIAHEPTTQTGIKHVEGAISMARGAPGTATSDFFILTGPMPGLDAHPEQTGDNLGFAAFGHVVEGMDVVRSILSAPTSATKGEGVMKGQMLEPEVKIVAAKRVK
jgi:peptidyl-prolyl cis-trans isomerase A (cyclophilin A)